MGIIRFSILLVCLALATAAAGLKKKGSPPHCTQVTKDTDYASRFRFDYPAAYITPGQREGYQPLHCIKPAAVNKGVTVVCDWAAPPQVMFTMGDEYVHVVRQDPSGRYLGNLVITTYQLCNHTLAPHSYGLDEELPFVSEFH